MQTDDPLSLAFQMRTWLVVENTTKYIGTDLSQHWHAAQGGFAQYLVG